MELPEQETLFEFPCEYPIKIMGYSSVKFEKIVKEILSKHVRENLHNSIQTKVSSNKKYVSITVNITAQNRQQLDALYLELTEHPDVLYLL